MEVLRLDPGPHPTLWLWSPRLPRLHTSICCSPVSQNPRRHSWKDDGETTVCLAPLLLGFLCPSKVSMCPLSSISSLSAFSGIKIWAQKRAMTNLFILKCKWMSVSLPQAPTLHPVLPDGGQCQELCPHSEPRSVKCSLLFWGQFQKDP